METAYGMEIRSKEDKFLRVALEALRVMNKALVPGGFLVDTMPIRASHEAYKNTIWFHLQSIVVKYVPEWFPGAGFKTVARVGREKMNAIVNESIEYVKESIKVSLRCPVSQR